ncbi:MAG: ABC transporter permease [Candidatus Aminicenantes bacterium]|nr:ABC transporter permease [Candidatus Aminicenantes bacterium]
MRLIGLIKKTMVENFRDWKIMVLILTFAPFFIFLMHFYYGETTKGYRITVVNHDSGLHGDNGKWFRAGEELVSELKQVRSPQGKILLKIHMEKGLKNARKRVENRSADLVVEIPRDFSRILMDYKQGSQPDPAMVRTYGDPSNLDYLMAAVWSDIITYQYASRVTGWTGPLDLQAIPVGNMKSLNEFDLYVPGLLVLAVMMLMFTAAASLIKEKDKETLVRLRMSRMTTFEWLLAVSFTQIIIGLLALALAFLSALAVGYETDGSLLAMMVVGLLSCLSVMAIGIIVAAFLRTVFDLMTIGCFPFFILMFFSGGMFPLPRLHLFSLFGQTINVNDILPTTHTISALNQILNYGASLGDVFFELAAILILTVIYFSLGAWIFTRRHMMAR